MLAASPYSGASARKPGGGGGSSMCSTRSPQSAITLMYRLSGRCMKGNLMPIKDPKLPECLGFENF